MKKPQETPDEKPPAFDDVLKRMLSAPPKHKTSDKPADKKQPAKAG